MSQPGPNTLTVEEVSLRPLTRKAVVALIAVLLLTPPFAWAQSIENSALNGVVSDEEGGALPGVTVTLSSEALGTAHQTQTDERGWYRFVGVLPGTYAVQASLEGFSAARQALVRLTVGKTLRVDFDLKVGSFEETIEVTGDAPLIDVQDSQLATMELSNEILMDVPTGKSIRGIVTLGAGIHSAEPDGGSFSAYGSSEQGIQYAVDGVTINSPEAGETEVNLDFDALEDVSILGLGAPAEYDGFSGVIVNAVTKSGTNQLGGLVDLYFEDNDWNSTNTSDEDLQRGGAEQTVWNAHVNVGGPIEKDKAWFFVSAKNLEEESRADPGFAGDPTFSSPRVIGKVNWVPSKEQALTAMVEYSSHAARNQGADDGGFFSPGTTFDNEQTQWLWNVNYTNMLSENTFLEAKLGGYVQRQDEIPESGDVPARFDEFEDKLFDNWFGPFVADRERYLLAASVTHFTDEFLKGSHDFKFGAEAEETPVHTLAGYSGGKYYISQGGEPYIRYDSDGYDTFAETNRFSAYAQDSWSVTDNVRLNVGLRLNYWRGDVESNANQERVQLGTIFKPDVALAPRIGVTIDLAKDHTAVLKAHYGRYYHQVIALYYSRLAPESDLSGFIWNPDDQVWEEDFTEIRDSSQFTLDDNLKMPFFDSFALGFEKQLAKNVSIDVTATYRENRDFLDKVNLTGEFEELEYTDEFTGQTFLVVNQTNEGDNQFLFTNVEKCKDYGQAYKPITCFEKKREYFGVTASLNKRWSDNWQLQASYTYGEATGNDDNLLLEFGEGRSSSLGGTDFYTNPNSQINADGHLSIDPTHLFKVVGSAELPGNVIVGGFFRFFSGNTYNQIIPVFDVDQETNIYGAAAGSFRQDDGINLDLRVEKLFDIGETSASVGVDIFNATNESTPIEREQSVDSELAFGSTTRIVRPRSIRVEARFRF